MRSYEGDRGIRFLLGDFDCDAEFKPRNPAPCTDYRCADVIAVGSQKDSPLLSRRQRYASNCALYKSSKLFVR